MQKSVPSQPKDGPNLFKLFANFCQISVTLKRSVVSILKAGSSRRGSQADSIAGTMNIMAHGPAAGRQRKSKSASSSVLNRTCWHK